MQKDLEAQTTGRERVLLYRLNGSGYLNVTSRCTLRCRFCPKFDGQWEIRGYPLRLGARELPSAGELVAAVGDPSRYAELVFCGLGEPTLRLPVVLETARALHGRGASIRLNTDGLANLVHGRDVTPELATCVDAVSISLNAQNAEIYDRICRPQRPGAYAAVLAFARRARALIPSVTLTAIDGLPGVDIDACRRIAEDLGCAFRRRILDDVG